MSSKRMNLRKVNQVSRVTPGALASGVPVTQALHTAAADKLRVISVNHSFAWIDKAAADEGAEFGYAHSDYTAAEIEECLEAFTSIDLGDKIAQEQANRLVRSVGTIAGDASGGRFADGRKVKTRLNWLLAAGDAIHLWVRNSSGTVWITGSEILVNGEMWVKD